MPIHHDAEVGRVFHHDAGRQEVELDAARGVAGVRAAIDLQHHRDRRTRAPQFVGDLGNEAPLAFVTEGNADISNYLTGERGQ